MTRSLSHQLLASLVGRAFVGGLQFIFTPIYVAALGLESYGLIGFYLSLFGLLLFLDQAVSPIVTRRFASGPQSAESGRLEDVFHTMEILSLALAAAIFAILFCLASWISVQLLHANDSTLPGTISAVRLIALMIAVQWPSYMYAGAMAGRGRQVELNAVRGGFAAFQWIGGAALLFAIQGDIHWLLAWQAMCFMAQTLALRHRALADLPDRRVRRRFRTEILFSSWRFSAGALVIGLTGSVLTQVDKLVVSRFEALNVLATYSLSFTVASVIQVFVAQPVMSIAFPHFVRTVAAGREDQLASEYRRWTQAVVVAVLPLTGVLVFFPGTVMAIWLHGHPEAARLAASYLPWIALGTALNVVMMLPFNLQLANSWTALSSVKNLILIPPFLVALVVGVPREGAIVGAVCWFAINCSYFLFEVPAMHRRLLRGVLMKWWLNDTTLPALATAAAFLAFRLLAPADEPTFMPWKLIAPWALSTSMLVLALEFPRGLLFALLHLRAQLPAEKP